MDNVAKEQALRALKFVKMVHDHLEKIASGTSEDVQEDWLFAHDYAQVIVSVADENLPPPEDR